MQRVAATVVALLAFAGPASAKLELRNVQASHGPLGPERTSLDVSPLDEIHFRFLVAGVKTDADGRTDAELSVRLTNADGKAVVDQRGPVRRELMLGGDVLPSQAFISIGPKAPPGEYTLKVTFIDKIAKESASFERKLTCKPTTFQILVPRFFYDADGKVPGPAGGVVGETVYVRLRVVGFDKGQGKIRTTMTLNILDAAGKDVMPKPLVVKADLSNAEEVQKATQVNFNGAVLLNRPGEFRLRITVEDLIGKKKSVFETPLKATMP